MDQDWRSFERVWRSDPGDQDALHRAITARRRAGLPVPDWMLKHQLFEARRFKSEVPFEVFVLLPDGRTQGIGHVPVPGGVELPEHRELWVLPARADNASFSVAIDEVVAQRIGGLAVPNAAKNATLAIAARAGHLTRLDLGACADVKDLDPIGELPHLATLNLWWCEVGDRALEPVGRAASLVCLNLTRVARLTAKGTAHLAGLNELAVLELTDCPGVNDAALAPLSRLGHLTALSLAGTAITDAGLDALAPLRELTLLNLSRTKITAAGLEKLAPLENLAQLYVLSCGDASHKAERVLRSVLPKCQVVAAAAPARS